METIKKLAADNNFSLNNILYVGNDLNDYLVIQLCGHSACPADSHSKIKSVSSIILSTNGGDGIVRELLEEVFNLDFIKILYQSK